MSDAVTALLLLIGASLLLALVGLPMEEDLKPDAEEDE